MMCFGKLLDDNAWQRDSKDDEDTGITDKGCK